MWRLMERPLHVVSRIIRAEMIALLMVANALHVSMLYHGTWELPQHRYIRLASESFIPLVSDGDTSY